MDTETRRQLLADIASFYFVEKKTQAEIALISGYSRSAISRILTEAEDLGIIEIKIKYPLLREKELERRLQKEFSLETAYVINSGLSDYSHNINLVGRLGASYFQNNIFDGMVIGIGWGSSLYELVNALPFLHKSNIKVVQVIGASGGKSDTRVDGPDLAALLASKLSASHKFLHSPLFMDSEAACKSLKDQQQIKTTLELGYLSDIVLLGIGTIDVDRLYSSIFRSGLISEQEVKSIKAQGGVANFCGVILDENGIVLDIELNRRTMAVDIQRLRLNGCKLIGIAAGSQKSQAINAVLKGNWLDILFTDSSAVLPILQ
ncbi:MAG: sugar-binding domain-containing protein [Pelolinea sp.]|nr:sugar-binding domain-containing protein [Pelolinea sp.]